MQAHSVSVAKRKILIVDDEPDIHSVTRLSLKGLLHRGERIEFLSADTAAAALAAIRSEPNIAVVLLDVIMETTSAGLDACRAIREQLGNRFVRILLRTGQPGTAPERKSIDEFDIDGYLPKAELTSERLYAAVRTGLKAYEELIELDRHRRYLAAIHDCALSLQSFEPLGTTLEKIISAAVGIGSTDLALLRLDTFDQAGTPQRYSLHLAAGVDPVQAEIAADELGLRIMRSLQGRDSRSAGSVEGGYLQPIVLHRQLGEGWIFLRNASPDELSRKALQMLSAHAANSLYSAVAQTNLAAREGPLYETMIV